MAGSKETFGHAARKEPARRSARAGSSSTEIVGRVALRFRAVRPGGRTTATTPTSTATTSTAARSRCRRLSGKINAFARDLLRIFRCHIGQHSRQRCVVFQIVERNLVKSVAVGVPGIHAVV